MPENDILSLDSSFICPRCGASVVLTLKDVGKSIYCHKCKLRIDIEKSIDVADADAETIAEIKNTGIKTK